MYSPFCNILLKNSIIKGDMSIQNNGKTDIQDKKITLRTKVFTKSPLLIKLKYKITKGEEYEPKNRRYGNRLEFRR